MRKPSRPLEPFNNIRALGLIICGNLIDYYDFLLFAHLGGIITPIFMPNLDSRASQLISLFLFGLPFIVRPLGGYIFGKIADLHSKTSALTKSLEISSIATLALAILPTYDHIGFISCILFVILRGLQGFSLGGEYTTAGTLLMENYRSRQGLISGILCASGTVGSLIALFISSLYAQSYLSGSDWRFFFLLASIGTFVSSYLRRKLKAPSSSTFSYHPKPPAAGSIWVTFLTGMLISILCWVPMVYTNFYFTKVLGYPLIVGIQATFTALTGYIVLNIVCGAIADYFPAKSIMTVSAFLALPFGWIGCHYIIQGKMIGQLFLVLIASSFGSVVHVFLNQIFAPPYKSRGINTSFMLGSSLGGISPFISGYIQDHYHYPHCPLILIMTTSLMTFVTLLSYKPAPLLIGDKPSG